MDWAIEVIFQQCYILDDSFFGFIFILVYIYLYEAFLVLQWHYLVAVNSSLFSEEQCGLKEHQLIGCFEM